MRPRTDTQTRATTIHFASSTSHAKRNHRLVLLLEVRVHLCYTHNKTVHSDVTFMQLVTTFKMIFGSRPSDHYFRSVCRFVCAESFSAVFYPISIKLGHTCMLYVWV